MESIIYQVTKEALREHSKEIIKEALEEFEKRKNNNQTYYINQVAKLLHKSPNTIKKLCEKGYIRTTADGQITQEALDEYLKGNQK